MEGFEGLSEEQLQQLLELGLFDDENSQLDKQMEQAYMLRNKEGPQMRGNGRVMVANNPLEFLASGIEKYQAGKELGEIGERRKEIGGKQVAARKALLDALRGNAGAYQGTIQNDPGINMGGFA